MTGVISKRGRAALLMASTAIVHVAGGNMMWAKRAWAEEAAITLPTVQVEGAAPTTGATADTYRVGSARAATKTDAPVIETPQSVTTISRKQLDDQNPGTVKEALNYTAGVLSTPDTNGRYDSVFMRGFGGFGTSTRIVDFLDGLKLPRGQAFALPSVDPFLLDRVEVLKGPSAVLYGQTSPGGLIDQMSRTPGADFRGEARIEGGNPGRLQGGVTTQGAIDDQGHWRYGISANGRRADSRYDDVEEERVAVAPVVSWRPSADTTMTLRAFYQYDPEGGYFNSIYPKSLAPDAYKSALDRDLNMGDPGFDDYERRQFAIGYDFEHRFNDLVSIGSKTRYSALDLDFQSLQMAGAITSAGLIPRLAVRSVEEVGGVSSDNHLRFDFATGTVDHTVLAGVDFQRSSSDWEYRFGAASTLDVADPTYGVAVGSLTTIIDSKQTLRQTGVYLQDQIAYGGLRVVLGTRHDWTEQETENRLAGTSSRQSSDAGSHRVGLLYKFDNGLAPYASYSTSFEPTVGVDVAGAPFEPTEAKQWEVGLKYEPAFVDALFTVSAFHIRQTNVLTPDATTGFNVQQGEVRSRGLEFEARGQLTPDLELIAALTLLDTEVTKSTVATTIGKRPQAVPTYHGSAWANYAFDGGALDGLTLGAGVRVVGASFADDANTIETDGYVLVDAMARYDLEKLGPSLRGVTATLNVTNLFDKEYYSSCTSNFYCQYGNGAQALLGLRYEW